MCVCWGFLVLRGVLVRVLAPVGVWRAVRGGVVGLRWTADPLFHLFYLPYEQKRLHFPGNLPLLPAWSPGSAGLSPRLGTEGRAVAFPAPGARLGRQEPALIGGSLAPLPSAS